MLALSACQDEGGTPADAGADATLACPDAGPAECDDRNSCSNDHAARGPSCELICSHDLLPTCCGNGIQESGEACDDGNQAAFDGCSRACTFERALIVQTATLEAPPNGCDLNGDGTVDNAIGVALNDAARMALSNFVTTRSFQGNPVVSLLELEGPDPLMLSMPWTMGGAGGLDTDMPADPNDNYSGNEPFFVLPQTLDTAGRATPRLQAQATAGVVTSNQGTFVLTLPNGGTFSLQRLELATISGTLEASGSGPTSMSIRLCGAQTAGSFHRIANATPFGGNGVTILDTLVVGATFFAIHIAPTQPDVDVDGDGLEQFQDVDGNGLIDLCIDGNGTQIAGHDCPLDPRIADGYSVAWDITSVSVRLAGLAP